MTPDEKKKREQELAHTALHFLKDTELRGKDMPAFSAVWNWLQGIALDEPAPQAPRGIDIDARDPRDKIHDGRGPG